MLKFKTFMQEYWQLIKLHLANNRRMLLLFVGAFIFICGAKYLDNDYRHADRDIVLSAIIVLSTAYTLCVSMNDYYRHRKVYSAQLLPASNKAKFLSEVTVSLVIIPLVLTLIHTAIDLVAFLSIENEAYDSPLKQWGAGYADWLVVPVATYVAIIANSVATLLKTRVNWIFAAMLGLSFLALLLMNEIGVMDNYPGVSCYFRPIRNFANSSYTSVVVHSAWAGPYITLWATRIWLWVLPIACYVWAYFRFKEWSSR